MGKTLKQNLKSNVSAIMAKTIGLISYMFLLRKLSNFIKVKWVDPVWSKVFATGIVGIFSTILVLIWSLIRKIPFSEFLLKSLNYLIYNKLTINYLTILIILLIILVVIGQMLSKKILRSYLMQQKLPNKYLSNKFNLLHFLDDHWQLEYSNKNLQISGKEIVTFINGIQYHRGGFLGFILTQVEFDSNNKKLKWTKTTLNNQKFARETLSIINNNIMKGKDDIGFTLLYTRLKNQFALMEDI